MKNNIDLRPLFKLIFSVFHSLFFVVKLFFLSAISVPYFVIGGLAAILYLIFYEKLFKTLLISLGGEKETKISLLANGKIAILN